MPAHARTGVHFLSAHAVVRHLIRSSGVGPDDLVIDFGAGPGTITAPLAATGARVLAVEQDTAFVRKLTRRFADQPLVKVVHADLATVALPGRDFAVVANIPFALSTVLLRRLMTRPRRSLARADLVVEWGFARRLTEARTKETARWAEKYELRVASRISRGNFRPGPSVDAAHLVIRRRERK